MSIKPAFAEKIFEGTKKYEFRRAIFKNQQIEKVIVYASSRIKWIIGEFEIDKIISLDLVSLWNKTGEHSGITKVYFDEYFVKNNHGFAIKIKNIGRYKTAKRIREDYHLISSSIISIFTRIKRVTYLKHQKIKDKNGTIYSNPGCKYCQSYSALKSVHVYATFSSFKLFQFIGSGPIYYLDLLTDIVEYTI